MLPEIITFKKSLSDRLVEYQTLLGEFQTPCSEVKEVWANIFEDFLSIRRGWQALWMVSESNCRKYDLLHPSAVIVFVNGCNWHELLGNVSVVAVQDDILLPAMLDVPLIELHPMKVQEFSEFDLKHIADWFDKCRFFFNNLWYPWDAKCEVNISEWCSTHLKNRLDLQYDIINGNLDKPTCNYIKSLISEAQELEDVLEKISSDTITEEERLILINCYVRRKVIKVELDLFEEPDLKPTMSLMKKREKHIREAPKKGDRDEVILVCRASTLPTYLALMEAAKTYMSPNSKIKVACNLSDALEKYNQGELILLFPGNYHIKKLMGFESGGKMKGVTSAENISITEDPSRLRKAILFEVFGPVTLENITIQRKEGICLQIFSNTTKISNCRFLSHGSTSSKGIVVISGSRLELNNCEFSGFGTAIILQKDAIAVISNTIIHKCHEGIKLSDNSQLTLTDSKVIQCSGYGIRLESDTFPASSPVTGDLVLLTENISPSCKVVCQGVDLGNNKKGKVFISKACKNFVIDNSSDGERSRKNSASEEDDFGDDVVEYGRASTSKPKNINSFHTIHALERKQSKPELAPERI